MPKTNTRCPQCRQPVVAEVEQLFDPAIDPKAKQRFLSGNFNIIHCQNCGFQGNLATPLLYHDSEKELLLTYFPAELGLPVNEQEKIIGPLINKVMNQLPLEKRKAYLLRPMTMLTMQQMIERVLESDGITHDMIQAQQQRLNLLQRLFASPPEGRDDIIRKEEALIDESLFSMLSRLIEASMAQGDEQSGRMLSDLQTDLLSLTKVGRELQARAAEAEEAVKSLQEASKNGLTREILLDLIINAPTETRLATLVSMARSGLDYSFFQNLSDQIDVAADEGKEKLSNLRDKLLEMVQEIDQAVQKQTAEARKTLEAVLKARNIPAALQQNADLINQTFVDVLKAELQSARQTNDQPRLDKLTQVFTILQQASAPPPEIALAQELVTAKTDEDRQKILSDHASEITPEFLQLLSGLVTQGESQNQPTEVIASFKEAYSAAIRFSMSANLAK